MTRAMINPNILVWARKRAGIDPQALARKLNVKSERLLCWEDGNEKPTFIQARNFARHTYVPFGYLFLEQPPKEEISIPDLRTQGSKALREISVNLRDTIRDVLERQIWYREYRLEQDAAEIDVVGRLFDERDARVIAADIRNRIGIGNLPEEGSWESHWRDLVNHVESLGILVMRGSVVGSNTSRPLSVDEFRGFAIADPYAPVIFINTADYPGSRLFTLLHELTHIWIGKSGISDARLDSRQETETLCNAVAAEFLAPETKFLELWNTGSDDWRAKLPKLAGHFHVSLWVIARRALELRLIKEKEYWTFVSKLQEDYRKKAKKIALNYNRLQTLKVSKRFVKAVASEALSGRMLLQDAWRLTGIRPEKLADYARRELGI